MATTFFLRTRRKSGFASVCVRVQSSTLKINIRQSTNLKVSVKKWNLSRSSAAFRDFVNSEEGRRLFGKIEEIRLCIDSMIVSGWKVSAAQVRKIVHDVVYREYVRKRADEMTLNLYIERYLEQVTHGTRKTNKGTNFSQGTISSLKMVSKVFSSFQSDIGIIYDFEDIDYDFRTKFMNYLFNDKRYNINTAAKCLNTLITILTAAEAEGYHSNRKCICKQFKAKRKDVDMVYLTKEELISLTEVDISHLAKTYEIVRDIFLVGVYTAQRVSDYNHLSQENIIRNPDGTVIIKLRQKKTGVWVSIPAKDELKRVLAKYGYTLPHISEPTINSCVKEVARLAGIDEPITFETTSGGVPTLQTRPKYALIQSHTARRTGATLMYLAGMNVFNICSVTGHSSIAMLKKYIKAGEIERAKTISSDAAFTKW